MIARSAFSQDYQGLSPRIFHHAMLDLPVLGLMTTMSKVSVSYLDFQTWVKSSDGIIFTKLYPNADDCGGLASFITHYEIGIETRNCCGFRIPGERKSKYTRSAGLTKGLKKTILFQNPILSASLPTSSLTSEVQGAMSDDEFTPTTAITLRR